jgi:hypothetical protein
VECIFTYRGGSLHCFVIRYFIQCPILMCVVTKLKTILRNRAARVFFSGRGRTNSRRTYTLTWSYADLKTLFHTLEGTVAFSVMTLFRSGVSIPSQFRRLILRQPRARMTDILTASREDVFVCD